MRESLFDPETGKLRDPDAFKDKRSLPGVSVLGDTHVTIDERGSKITRHADGSQGVVVRPTRYVHVPVHREPGAGD